MVLSFNYRRKSLYYRIHGCAFLLSLSISFPLRLNTIRRQRGQEHQLLSSRHPCLYLPRAHPERLFGPALRRVSGWVGKALEKENVNEISFESHLWTHRSFSLTVLQARMDETVFRGTGIHPSIVYPDDGPVKIKRKDRPVDRLKRSSSKTRPVISFSINSSLLSGYADRKGKEELL